MNAPDLIIGLPSKGRLKEQLEGWLVDGGFRLEVEGGERGYRAVIAGLPGVQVQLLSAGDIASGLFSGDLHLGVTGEDLLRERGEDFEAKVLLLRALGFGRADLVVAAPQSWLDVDTMADLDEVAAAYVARTGRRLRVATKYTLQTRRFFANHGLVDYRIVESGGATEGAPAAGAAEVIVDITTSGATLRANGLKILDDGVILKSQAHLTAGLGAAWTNAGVASVRRLMGVVEARARARSLVVLTWPAETAKAAQTIVERFQARGASPRPDGMMIDQADLFEAAEALSAAKVGPVSVTRPEFAFAPEAAAVDRLEKVLILEN